MKKILSLAFVFSMVVFVAGGLTASVASATANNGPQIHICHQDNSDDNDSWNDHQINWNDFGSQGHEGDFINEHPEIGNWCHDHHNDDNNESTATVNVTKIVCPTEDLLPNWGAGAANITSTTATTFLAAHETCHAVPWTFEWAPKNATNPGNNSIGATGGMWHAFTGGTTTVPAGNKIWLREQMQAGYIPFSGATSNLNSDAAKNSAEFYCNTDVLNYDNFDWISPVHAGHTYNCVGFNVPTTPPQEQSCITAVVAEGNTKITSYGTPFEGHPTLQEELDAFYTPAGTINDLTDDTGYQVWNVPAGTLSVTIHPKLVGASSGQDNTFGYYINSDASTFTPIFTIPAGTNTLADPGNFVINTTGATTLGFAIKTAGGSIFTTEVTATGNSNSGDDHAVVFVPPASTGKYTIAFEDAPFSSADKDYNDLVAEVSVVSCSNGPSCTPTSGDVVSDATTANTTDGGFAVPLSFIHPAWTASIPGATWIWATDPVVGPTNSGTDLTKVFTKTFTVTGTPTSGTLDVAVDNSYTVKVNGTSLPVPVSEDHFELGTQDSYNIGSLLVTGTNTIEITATNWESVDQSPDPAANPAGVLFKVTWASDCGQTPPPQQCPVGDTGTYPNCVPPIIITGCTNGAATNYNPEATPGNVDAGQCTFDISCPIGTVGVPPVCNPPETCPEGQTGTFPDCSPINNNPGTPVLGCTNPAANNYDSQATPGNANANDCTFGGGGGGGGNPNNNTGGGFLGSNSGGGSGGGKVLGAETSCGIYVDKYLKKGLKSNDKDAVTKVQKFLNDYFHAGIKVDGVYGATTEAAVKAFQLAHKDKIMDPWHITVPTGIFYITTQTEVNNIMCPTLNLQIPSPLINYSDNPAAPKI